VQFLENDPYLCAGNSVKDLVIPDNGAPIALLAMRGECTYETKGRTAGSVYGKENPVHYVIVFDNVDDASLVSMSAENPTGINVGLLFISKDSGADIIRKNNEALANSRSPSGIFLLMDSEEPYETIIDPYAWVAFIFMMMTCCGGLALCCHAGYIRRDGTIIIVGRPQVVNGSNLMTREQVLALPEVEFTGNKVDDIEADVGKLCRIVDDVGNDLNQPLLPTSASPDSTVESNIQQKSISVSLSGENSTSENSTIGTGYQWNASCSICLDDYEPNEKLRMLPCGHQFHTDCILPWLTERQGLCPLCKQQVLPEEEEVPEEDSVDTVTQMDDIGRFSSPITQESNDETPSTEEAANIIASSQRSRVMQWLSLNRRRALRSSGEVSAQSDGNQETPLLVDRDNNVPEIMSV